MTRPCVSALAPLLAALSLGLVAPALAAGGWSAEAGPGTAALLFGKAGVANSFRLDCSSKGMSISTWTKRLPRNVAEGSFPTQLSVFQGSTERVLGATGQVLATGGTRIDALVDNPQAFLDGMGRQRQFVVVNFSGRAMAPAPTAGQLEAHGKACSALRP